MKIYVFALLRGALGYSLLASAVLLFAPSHAGAKAPTIVCPANILASNDLGQCSTPVVFIPTLTGAPPPDVFCTPPSGTAFLVGTNTVSCLASNKDGTASCSFLVIVKDIDLPSISCPTNITVECGTPIAFAPTIADNCPGVISVCTPPSGSLFPLGPTTVTCSAIDASGNNSQCNFVVTGQDTTPPAVTCLTNFNAAEFPHDSGFAVVNFPAPVVTDLCDGKFAAVCSPPAGSVFALGYTPVSCTAIDSSGNSNGCSFTVRVIPYRLPVTSTDDSGAGTVRQALLDANDAPGENRIEFHLPNSGRNTIDLLSALPPANSPVIIDGSTQAGFNGAPLIEIDGGLTGGADGLVITAGDSTVRGLVLHGFLTAIRLEGNGGNTIQGNYIGSDGTGTNAPGNLGDGIYVSSPRNLIGGTAPSLGNIISGNAGNGIHLDTADATGNLVQGNFIGTNPAGALSLQNSQNGVLLANGAVRNTVGGGNVIRFNGLNGISLDASAGVRNAISGNSIFSNGGLGIDLGADGVTANDPGDADEGPNRLQNFPELSDVRSLEGATTIDGTIDGPGQTFYRLEFFLNDAINPSGFGEGQLYLGSTSILASSAGSQPFSVSFPVTTTVAQFITATATDGAGNSSEFAQALQVRTPPVLHAQPVHTNVNQGASVTFCATATGTPPFLWQWRLNGANIPGANDRCYTIPNANLANGGNYTVVVWNGLGAMTTIPASLTLPLPELEATDNFADRVTLPGTNGTVSGSNRLATQEPGEPQHAGKPGGKSVWYRWVAPTTGIATIGTTGSTFDTLLAVYTGSAVTNLTPVGSDEDRGGFYTSGLRFDAISGIEYQIAVDGYYGASGDFDFGWSFEDTPHLMPLIIAQPQSLTVAPGDTATFGVLVQRVCGQGHVNCPDPGDYPGGVIPLIADQWFFNGDPIIDATNAVLTVTNVQADDVGDYSVEVTQQDPTHPRSVDSQAASLQINLIDSSLQNVQSFDKFQDAANAEPLRLGAPPDSDGAGGGERPRPAIAGTVVSGYTGTQIFNTTSNSSQGETFCGTAGGASRWLTLVAARKGHLIVSTEGSSYDTLLAVFTTLPNTSPTNPSNLQLLGCDNNSGANKTSKLNVPVEAGSTNYIGVDGVQGAYGTLVLNFNLCPDAFMKSLGVTPTGANHLQVNVRTNLAFAIQISSDLVHWSTLVTTNSPTEKFDFFHSTTPPGLPRFYRALLCP